MFDRGFKPMLQNACVILRVDGTCSHAKFKRDEIRTPRERVIVRFRRNMTFELGRDNIKLKQKRTVQ